MYLHFNLYLLLCEYTFARQEKNTHFNEPLLTTCGQIKDLHIKRTAEVCEWLAHFESMTLF